MKNKKLYLIIGIFGIIFMFFGGTLSFLQWRTSTEQQTNVAFTVTEDFSCSADGGGNITNGEKTLMPTTSCTNELYAIQRTITVNNILNTDKTNLTMDLWLNINSIGDGLKNSENLRYALTTTANDCTNGVVSYGTFTGKNTNDKVLLLDDEMYSGTRTDTYYLYIWMDADEISHNIVGQSIDLSLGGNCTGASKGEPFYAVYSEDDTSLRFYKEQDGVIIEGEPYEGRIASNVYLAYENDVYLFNQSTTRTTTPWDDIRNNVTKIIVEDEIKPHSLDNWFIFFQNTSSIDVTKLNTENVVSMNKTFGKTGENITSSFSIVGLNNWNTSKVKDMNSVFNSAGYNTATFNIGDLSNWDTSNVIDMRFLFSTAGYNASSFDVGNLDNWNTSKVGSMYGLFNGAGTNSTILFNIGDLSAWDVSNVMNMQSMFNSAGKKAPTFDIGNLDNWDVSNVTNMYLMFNAAGSNSTIFNIGNLSNWNVSNVTNMRSLFNEAGHSAQIFNIGNLNNWDVSNVTNMQRMFVNAGYNATTFNIGNLSNWDTSNVTDMRYMFEKAGYSSNVFNIGDLSAWNVSNITNMGRMFYEAGHNATIFNIGDISKWNTSNVENMYYMFYKTGYNASNWSLDLSEWNVDKVISYTNFNKDVETKITAPTWVNEDQGEIET